ncbi:hypothetical protein [Sphingobacterium chungjuense]|uniref:hypothetical protein n=1 Tax=Sphingobacterium chungjuense TaxID=2675553 RepID=UPI00140E8BC7|nr:hypothetical protein [Sphingobacterium chungjuense]
MKIGITGHQEFEADLTDWIENEITKEITMMRQIRSAYTCLAIGADQLFAKVMISLNIQLTAIIPCSRYEDTFDTNNRERYLELLSLCKQIKKLNYSEPSEKAFLEAGHVIAEESDVLFAIWDGKPAKGLGGTADIVEYALNLKKMVIHLNTISKEKLKYNG